jgi:hypothetical protein
MGRGGSDHSLSICRLDANPGLPLTVNMSILKTSHNLSEFQFPHSLNGKMAVIFRQNSCGSEINHLSDWQPNQ